MRKAVFILLFVSFCIAAPAQTISPDDTKAASLALAKLKNQLLTDVQKDTANRLPIVRKMLETGLWQEALAEIKANLKEPAYQVLLARYYLLQNDFTEAGKIIDAVLEKSPANGEAASIKAFLSIQAWRLPEAAAICEAALRHNQSEELQLMLGRVRLLQKNYSSALKIAREVKASNPNNADAFLLEADVYFWDQKPALAEPPLRKSLELNPFNADARFSYGYAIWRRIDATQLKDMAAQWELALAIDPLHYQTHWHWGNGHTHLTYADYREENEDTVRKALEKADAAVQKNEIPRAIQLTREAEKSFPASVLPLLYRASFYYMSFDMDRKERLDSAQKIFVSILERKAHYGPAHNGLSAVLKSKRIPYLAAYDSIVHALNATPINDSANFTRVFTDMAYYPGKTVGAMVWNQMYSSTAYFPFLSRQGRTFHVPPLHHDLAIAMNSPFFRSATTFDNRQWMDIRGVGSGAAAIEYVERGAFLERNVVLHEFVHLFHGTVLTDWENRRIRQLYYAAMQENRTLDYYSQNNESEYFAQTFPAYFEPVKVHPLDFKSMNTTGDLKSKDPAMCAFLDSLVHKNYAYLNGNEQAMADNWSQVYVNLSSSARRNDTALARRYLDTALAYVSDYLPALIAYGRLYIEKGNFEQAGSWLQKAQSIDSTYAPVYVAYSDMAFARAGKQNGEVRNQIQYLKKAYLLESDYQEKAGIAARLYTTLQNNALIPEAIDAADEYAKNAATISTYLRDRRDDAIAFSASLKAALGDTEAVSTLEKLVKQKPQNYGYRNLYADALAVTGNYLKAVHTLKEAQRILTASGSGRADFDLRIAENYLRLELPDSARTHLNNAFAGKQDILRQVRLMAAAGQRDSAKDLLETVEAIGNPRFLAEYYYTFGKLQQQNGEKRKSIQSFEKAISLNPYFLPAYYELRRETTGKRLQNLRKEFRSLPVAEDLKNTF